MYNVFCGDIWKEANKTKGYGRLNFSRTNLGESNMKDEKLMGVGIVTAFAAALCCITPVFAMLAGIGGIAATFSWIEPYRPYLMGATIFVLVFAWYQKLRPQTDCGCDEKPSFWQGKPFLGLITVFAFVMMAFPYYSSIFYSVNAKESKNAALGTVNREKYAKVVFAVDGMTCNSCETHVESEVNKLDGISEAKASYKDGKATIVFDKEKVTEKQIKDAIDSTGYKANKTSAPTTENDSRFENVVFAVDGMTCSGCQGSVENAAVNVDGVAKAKASYKDGKATVTFDKTKTNAKEIKKAINATGYTARSAK